MARRIPGEFVPLDLNLPRDIKIRKAGPDAELLYIRALIYLKGADHDGFIPDFDLPVIGVGLPKVAQSAKRLVSAGLWEEAECDGMTGFQCLAWLKWNMSAQEQEEQRKAKREGALMTNHKSGQHKEKPHPDCPTCTERKAA